MTSTLSNDRSTVVDKGYHWTPVEREAPPSGAKLQLINRRLGVAHHGVWTKGSEWTHWAPLPTFAPDDNIGKYKPREE